jgi:hypothetical protein
MSESMIENRFHHDPRRVLDEILPLMETHGIVERRAWKGSGTHRAWGLPVSLEEIERADGDPQSIHYGFWQGVDQRDATRGRR